MCGSTINRTAEHRLVRSHWETLVCAAHSGAPPHKQSLSAAACQLCSERSKRRQIETDLLLPCAAGLCSLVLSSSLSLSVCSSHSLPPAPALLLCSLPLYLNLLLLHTCILHTALPLSPLVLSHTHADTPLSQPFMFHIFILNTSGFQGNSHM